MNRADFDDEDSVDSALELWQANPDGSIPAGPLVTVPGGGLVLTAAFDASGEFVAVWYLGEDFDLEDPDATPNFLLIHPNGFRPVDASIATQPVWHRTATSVAYVTRDPNDDRYYLARMDIGRAPALSVETAVIAEVPSGAQVVMWDDSGYVLQADHLFLDERESGLLTTIPSRSAIYRLTPDGRAVAAKISWVVSTSQSTGSLLVRPGYEANWVIPQDEEVQRFSYELTPEPYEETGVSILDANLGAVEVAPLAAASLSDPFGGLFVLSEDGRYVMVMEFLDDQDIALVPVRVIDLVEGDVETVILSGPGYFNLVGVGGYPYIAYNGELDGSIRFIDWTSGMEYGLVGTHPPYTEIGRDSIYRIVGIYAA